MPCVKRRTFIVSPTTVPSVILPWSILQELSATNNVSIFRFSPAAETIFIRYSMRFIIFVDSSNVRLLLALPAHPFPSLPIPTTLLAECCLAFLREFLLGIEIAFVLPSTWADRWKWTIKRSTNPPRIVWKRWTLVRYPRIHSRQGEKVKRRGRLFMGRLYGGASVPCIDSTSFRSANEWLIFCPQMYGNATRERHFLIFAGIRR
ncbi:PREDICTED: uncharacterized protein LOC108760073 [Trachymyrmex cornetzi]|uniref:uncharacterized protein LOC108760073 n=1 Tax=Trachymyrmex cornetzi TaxID=471704 RepID=UPI00084F4AA8|nr:PREDICTED: uncharacterized protein LOC108760073 [Trachymyrmex cornetzi]